MPPKAKYPCIVCKQNVSDRDSKGSINCNVCQRYTHAPCANLDNKMLGWFCDMEAKEKELAKEAKRLTEEQNEEDFLVFEYRLVGRKGERVIRKLKKQVNGQTRGFSGRARGGRGQGRGRVNPRGRGAHSNPNLTPVRHQNRHNRSTDTLVGGEEEEEDNEANKRKRSDGSLVISPSSPGFSGTTKRAKRAAAAAAATEAAAEAEEEED